ncbi:hypothetical protein X768_31850 [Mesorhizobium sp. LSJC265A00]|nr:hypothetical protein X768_31850 [Mesorhizobium sp. LSJC265A00]
MAVALGDTPVAVVDAQLRFLVAADLPPVVNRRLFSVKMPRGAVSAAPLDIPAAAVMVYYMMCVRSALSYHNLVSFWTKVRSSTPTPNMMDSGNERCQAPGVVLL